MAKKTVVENECFDCGIGLTDIIYLCEDCGNPYCKSYNDDNMYGDRAHCKVEECKGILTEYIVKATMKKESIFDNGVGKLALCGLAAAIIPGISLWIILGYHTALFWANAILFLTASASTAWLSDVFSFDKQKKKLYEGAAAFCLIIAIAMGVGTLVSGLVAAVSNNKDGIADEATATIKDTMSNDELYKKVAEIVGEKYHSEIATEGMTQRELQNRLLDIFLTREQRKMANIAKPIEKVIPKQGPKKGF